MGGDTLYLEYKINREYMDMASDDNTVHSNLVRRINALRLELGMEETDLSHLSSHALSVREGWLRHAKLAWSKDPGNVRAMHPGDFAAMYSLDEEDAWAFYRNKVGMN